MDLQSYFETLMRRGDGDIFTKSELEIFINLMTRDAGAYQASKLISNSLATPKTTFLAFDFLEALLSSPALSSDHQFRVEIGRYRFLNEIIRLLSPKYNGLTTPEKVKSRAINFIQRGIDPNSTWFHSAEQSKISSVHKSLIESGIIQPQEKPAEVTHQPPTPTTVDLQSASSNQSIFENASTSKLLKSLLQSKSQSDLSAANRLIQNLVQEDAARHSRVSDLNQLIGKIHAVTELVDQMLTVEPLDTEMIGELLDTCKTLRVQLSNYETMDEGEVDSLLRASATIEKTLEAYNRKLESNTLLIGFDTEEHGIEAEPSLNENRAPSQFEIELGSNAMNLLQFENEVRKQELEVSEPEPKKKEPFEDILELSNELMKQSLSGRSPLNQLQQSKKCTLLELKQKNGVEDGLTHSKLVTSALPCLNSLTLEPATPPLLKPEERRNSDDLQLLDNHSEMKVSHSVLTSIKEIRLEEIEIRKSPLPIVLLNSELNNGIQVVITFGSLSQTEAKSILVTVITLTNQNHTIPLSNYTFALLPPPGIQVKLFPSSINELGAWKTTFLPPPVLTQVGLVQPNSLDADNIKMSYILSYSHGLQTFVHNSDFIITL